MAQLKEVLEIEKSRQTIEDCLVIHLFQEGTFYRAYEMSAWLCFRYIKQFKATHRQLKAEGESLVLIGFPVTSLERYLTESNIETLLNEDKKVDIKINPEYLKEYDDIEHLYEDYLNWKMCVPLKNSPKKGEEHQFQENNVNTINIEELFEQIIKYPIEQKTPIECMLFLSEIKQIIINKNR
ncbi:MAG: hypothetical protein IJ341_05585 [Bacteroidales bacterium]|nr:hypothetical protein [Bacteroidales bacterium]MBQ7819151.1 hypothetical protein [Bacteroidales bacterium]